MSAVNLVLGVFQAILPEEGIDIMKNYRTYRPIGRFMGRRIEQMLAKIGQSGKQRDGSLGSEYM